MAEVEGRFSKVIAVIITIVVLDLKAPKAPNPPRFSSSGRRS